MKLELTKLLNPENVKNYGSYRCFVKCKGRVILLIDEMLIFEANPYKFAERALFSATRTTRGKNTMGSRN
jgi:hypothetical protein